MLGIDVFSCVFRWIFHRNFMCHIPYILCGSLWVFWWKCISSILRIDLKMIFFGHHSFPCQEDCWFTSYFTRILYFSYTSLLASFGCRGQVIFLIWSMQRRKFSWRLQWLFSHHFEMSIFFYHKYFTSYIILLLGWTRIYVFYRWPTLAVCLYART